MRTLQNFRNLDEIVFEGRNKSYGAYYIRKEEGFHTLLALSITALLVFGGGNFLMFAHRNLRETKKFHADVPAEVVIISGPMGPIDLSYSQPSPELNVQSTLSSFHFVPNPIPDAWFVEDVSQLLSFDSIEKSVSQFPLALRGDTWRPINLQEILNQIKSDPGLSKVKSEGMVVYELFVNENGEVKEVTIYSNENPQFSRLCTKRLWNLRFIRIPKEGKWLALPIRR